MTLMERLAEYLMTWATARGRVFDITGTAGPEDLYLRRFYIIRSNYFNFFIHLFFRSDRDDLHDHPWDFCTYLIRGAYTEYKWDDVKKREIETRRCNYHGYYRDGRRLKKNTLVFRRATDQHKVEVDFDVPAYQPEKAALTFCFTGPTRREWGFVKVHKDSVTVGYDNIALPWREWVPWKKYLGLPDDAPGRG